MVFRPESVSAAGNSGTMLAGISSEVDELAAGKVLGVESVGPVPERRSAAERLDLDGAVDLAVPDDVVPGAVAVDPDAVDPDAVALDAVAPDAVAPDAVAPDAVVPDAA